jgi:hypothetical protein
VLFVVKKLFGWGLLTSLSRVIFQTPNIAGELENRLIKIIVLFPGIQAVFFACQQDPFQSAVLSALAKPAGLPYSGQFSS